ncbi:MAG: hypothetical protein M3281_05600 [Chloroflexota bacterium]|nr:hypothetical protein [Chloroflexota bacterium]
MARQALEESGDCADAYVLLAEAERDVSAAKALYEEGVRAGERALGPDRFETETGHFWGVLDTRPYMRAREGLAHTAWELGEREAAIQHAREMLRLNPGDNQGMRYVLVNWLLTEARDDDAWVLLQLYPDDASAIWAYSRALVTFRRQGEGREADDALREAFETNPFVPTYMLGAMELPKRLPEALELGGPTEAHDYLAKALRIWIDTPGALDWFGRVVAEDLAGVMGVDEDGSEDDDGPGQGRSVSLLRPR